MIDYLHSILKEYFMSNVRFFSYSLATFSLITSLAAIFIINIVY